MTEGTPSPARDAADSSASPLAWPLLLWAVQLVPALGLLAVPALRLRLGVTASAADWLVLFLAGGWFVLVCAMLARRMGRRWIRVRRRELLLASVSVLVVGVLADGALSWSGSVPGLDTLLSKYALRYRASVSTLGRLEPNQVLEVDGHPRLVINARGFRGPEIAIPKPEGTCRLVFLGGSQVFDQYGENWPVRVGALLSTPARPVDVINAGVPSHRTTDSIGKVLTDLWMLEPDVFILCQTWNDLKYLSRLSPEHPYRDEYQPLPDDWRIQTTVWDRVLGPSSIYRLGRSRLARIARGAEGERDRTLGATANPWGLRQYALNVALLCDLAQDLGCDIVLCTQARLPTAASTEEDRAEIRYEFVGMTHEALVSAFASCDEILRNTALEKGAGLIDMSGAFSGQSRYFADHIHFNAEGSAAAADFVARELRQSEALRDRLRDP